MKTIFHNMALASLIAIAAIGCGTAGSPANPNGILNAVADFTNAPADETLPTINVTISGVVNNSDAADTVVADEGAVTDGTPAQFTLRSGNYKVSASLNGDAANWVIQNPESSVYVPDLGRAAEARFSVRWAPPAETTPTDHLVDDGEFEDGVSDITDNDDENTGEILDAIDDLEDVIETGAVADISVTVRRSDTLAVLAGAMVNEVNGYAVDISSGTSNAAGRVTFVVTRPSSPRFVATLNGYTAADANVTVGGGDLSKTVTLMLSPTQPNGTLVWSSGFSLALGEVRTPPAVQEYQSGVLVNSTAATCVSGDPTIVSVANDCSLITADSTNNGCTVITVSNGSDILDVSVRVRDGSGNPTSCP